MTTKMWKALPVPPARIMSLQPTQPVTVEKPSKLPRVLVTKRSTIPRVLSTKRPTTKERMRFPGDFSTLSANIEMATVTTVSLTWLDKLEMSLEKPAKDLLLEGHVHCLQSPLASRLDQVLGLWGPSDASPLRCQAPLHDDISDVVGGWILL